MRGIVLSGTTVKYLGSFSYRDPNIPCGYQESATWNLIGAGGVYAWCREHPRTATAPDLGVPAAGPRTSTNPKAIIESSRTYTPPNEGSKRHERDPHPPATRDPHPRDGRHVERRRIVDGNNQRRGDTTPVTAGRGAASTFSAASRI